MSEHSELWDSLMNIARETHKFNSQLVAAGIDGADALAREIAKEVSATTERSSTGEPKKPTMTLTERIEHHRRMAESYHRAYEKRTVEDGATYDEWVFAPHAKYWSPYFGDNLIDLSEYPMSVQKSATMEADTYCITFPDWGPLGFKCWPSDNGFVMQTHFGGHDKDGKLWDFYAYGFVETNEAGEITRWETHVSPEYNDFLDKAIGIHGPFKNGPEEYMAAVARKLQEAGVDPQSV